MSHPTRHDLGTPKIAERLHRERPSLVFQY
jgi:hypothetical protein